MGLGVKKFFKIVQKSFNRFVDGRKKIAFYKKELKRIKKSKKFWESQTKHFLKKYADVTTINLDLFQLSKWIKNDS